MKKNLFYPILAVLGIIVGIIGLQANKKNQNSYLVLPNIEALSSSEVEVVSCVKEDGSVCVIIIDGVIAKEYKNKTRDLR